MRSIDTRILTQEIEALKETYSSGRESLMAIFQELQVKYGNLTDIIIQEVAHALGIHPAEAEGVATFYSFYHTKGQSHGKNIIRLCQTISCDMQGKSNIARQLENELGISFGETTKDGMFSLVYTNCLGMCDLGPAVLINDKLFAQVTTDKIVDLIEDCKNDYVLPRYPHTKKSNIKKRGPILNHVGGSARGLQRALTMKRFQVIAEITKSKLKGRGGAGFPTGIKWQLAGAAQGPEKYIVCNADEGEPGTFKDRQLLYEQTELMLEGMAIAAYTIGAQIGFIYLRGEYLYMKSHIEEIINTMRSKKHLGTTILGREGFDFDVSVRLGAGAYVCGEETALIESMEGRRGEPLNRPPYPVVAGYKNCPTSVNNVETFINAALICENGADWFTTLGSDASTGTKLFSVSGDCNNPGIYELSLGITIKDLLREVGGEGAKSVQVGGASGRCLTKTDFDTIIGYEGVPSGGSIIIFGQERDMLDVAKNFMEFFVEESCGQCTPCRSGNLRLLKGIESLEQGTCSSSQLRELLKLSESIQVASKCGLGQSSPNAFVSIIENFQEEALGRPRTQTEDV
ncbi:MAG: NAD(P)H-dependent oxidoreductase subunit E [Fibrobacterales bacterium]